jgi:hypothetical protein
MFQECKFQQQPEVRMVQLNHLLENRTIPNDPLFPNQWHFLNNGTSGGLADADMDADQAWDITTGGLTPAEVRKLKYQADTDMLVAAFHRDQLRPCYDIYPQYT